MKKARIYGDTNTHLTLTDKAQNAYELTDPVKIEEVETDDGYIYNVSGCIECDNLTEEAVNRVFEDLYDECFCDEDGEDDADEITVEEIVLNMMDGSPDYDKPMTLDIAKIDIENIRIDARLNDKRLPEDLTPEKYMEVWNSFCNSNSED